MCSQIGADGQRERRAAGRRTGFLLGGASSAGQQGSTEGQPAGPQPRADAQQHLRAPTGGKPGKSEVRGKGLAEKTGSCKVKYK